MCCKSRDQPHTLPVSPTCFDIGILALLPRPRVPPAQVGSVRGRQRPRNGPKALLGLVRGKSFASRPSLSVLELSPWVIPLGFSTCGSSVVTNGVPLSILGCTLSGWGRFCSAGAAGRCGLSSGTPRWHIPSPFLLFRGWILLSSSREAAGELYFPSRCALALRLRNKSLR